MLNSRVALSISSQMALVVLFLCLQYANFQARGQANESDAAVLLDFKRGITGDPNGILDSWSPRVPMCNWTGITCHLQQLQSVARLNLHNQNLSGTIRTSLGRLEKLEYLDLASNNFTGTIPAEIGNCTRLRVLNLGGNGLTGQIPDMFHSLQHLTILEVWQNRLHGHIPASIGNCSRLSMLSLQANRLTGSIASFVLPVIQTFNLWGNQLKGEIPLWLANCTNLEVLYLDRNNLSGRIPPTLGFAQNKLRKVSMAENRLTGPIPLSLTNCSSLEMLRLDQNSLTGSIPPQIGRLHRLQELGLALNRLSGNIPGSLGNLTSIGDLDLGNNGLNGTIPESFASLARIESLDLTQNNLSGSIPAAIKSCTHLAILWLGGNRLEGQIPPELGQIGSLSDLQLCRNRLTGEIPSSIGNLPRLQVLDLQNNRLDGFLPDSLQNLSSTLGSTFDISSNRLRGEIPRWIAAFDKVQIISLASNNFSGEIPGVMGRCNGLLKLNLSGNSLSGKIPSELGQLGSLRILDLSVNSLIGPIPLSLTTLADLQLLNVSTNGLQGVIPDNGCFSRFHNSSFLGNPLLCGSAVNTTCPDNMSKRKHDVLVWILPLVVVLVLIIMLVLLAAFFCYCIRGSKSTISGGPLKVFTHRELLAMTNLFDDSNILGQGGFSKVYRASWNGATVAVKVMKKDEETLDQVNKCFLAEAATLARLRHRNIVKVLGYCSTQDMLALVMEYMPNGSLGNYLSSGAEQLGSLPKLNIAMDVAQAMHYIQYEVETPIVHCDLKPGNVLIDANSVAKVADFGISKLVAGRDNTTVSVSNFRGTVGYAPPEYAQLTVVTTMGDVYSYGMLLLAMTTGKSPTDEAFQEGKNLRDWVLDKITREEQQHHEPETQGATGRIDRLLIKIGLLCTNANAASRPTVREIIAMLLDLKDTGSRERLIPSLKVLVEELDQSALQT